MTNGTLKTSKTETAKAINFLKINLNDIFSETVKDGTLLTAGNGAEAGFR